MRKTIYNTVFVLVIVLVGLSSCSSFIEEDTSSQYTDDKIVDSSEGALNLVTGVYSKWIDDMFRWGYFPKVLEFDADYISGPTWNFNKFGAGNFDGEPDVVDALWKGCYSLIFRVNYAIQHIDAMENISQEEKDNAIGEMEFHKALSYFLLVRAYGDVPIQDETGANTEGTPRKSQQEVFEYITTTLKDAAGKMYKNTDTDHYQKGHVSAGSAVGLLVKVYATWASYNMQHGTAVTIRTGAPFVTNSISGDKSYDIPRAKTLYKDTDPIDNQYTSATLYGEAANWGKLLIEDKAYGDYELIPDYDNLWKKTNATASEFLFSIGSVSGNTTYKTSVYKQYNGMVSTTSSSDITNGLYVGCTHNWYKLFENNTSTGAQAATGGTGYTTDKRALNGTRHFWRNSDQITGGKGSYYPAEWEDSVNNLLKYQTYKDKGYYTSQNSQFLAWTTKYSDVTDPTIENADANWPMLRYADVLLMYAEALNETGSTTAAKTYLDMVVNRSNGVVYKGYSLDTQVGMRSAIIEERAKELACEADRRWDLIRWGIYVDAMNAIGGSDDSGVTKNRTTKHLLFPLPSTEISTNKYINENNPGWQ